MSELHKFLFDGLPVRGMIVRLTDAWTEVLRRRAGNTETGAYPPAVGELLGEMAAAGVLMQSNIKFNGALVLQIFGDGPVKLAVAEVQSDLGLRATATVSGGVEPGDVLGNGRRGAEDRDGGHAAGSVTRRQKLEEKCGSTCCAKDCHMG